MPRMQCGGGTTAQHRPGKIACKCAAAERTRSQSGSGAMGLGIVQPEMVALHLGGRDLRPADLFHLLKQRGVRKHRLARRSPVIPAPAGDQIVDGGQGQALVVQMAVLHGWVLGSRIIGTGIPAVSPTRD